MIFGNACSRRRNACSFLLNLPRFFFVGCSFNYVQCKCLLQERNPSSTYCPAILNRSGVPGAGGVGGFQHSSSRPTVRIAKHVPTILVKRLTQQFPRTSRKSQYTGNKGKSKLIGINTKQYFRKNSHNIVHSPYEYKFPHCM